jgi:tight adherence protein B
MTAELYVLLAAIAILLLLAAFMATWIMRVDAREKKFDGRVDFVVSPLFRLIDPASEQVSLAKTVKQSEKIKSIAASIIGVDLAQAETYPIKWWLVPPLTLLISWVIIEIAVHPIGHAYFLFVAGWPLCWLFVTKFVFNWFNNKRNARLLEQFPDALSSIVRCVRVGIPMAEALRTVSRDAQEPTKAEFITLADKVSIGIPLDVALRELSNRIKLTEYQFFATALTLQARSGGGITQTLETLAEVIRKRVGLKARGYALTAEARTSAMILAILPFIAGGGIFVMQRPYMELLFYTASGQSCLGAAILMLGAGLGTIQYMISNVLK